MLSWYIHTHNILLSVYTHTTCTLQLLSYSTRCLILAREYQQKGKKKVLHRCVATCFIRNSGEIKDLQQQHQNRRAAGAEMPMVDSLSWTHLLQTPFYTLNNSPLLFSLKERKKKKGAINKVQSLSLFFFFGLVVIPSEKRKSLCSWRRRRRPWFNSASVSWSLLTIFLLPCYPFWL